MTKKELKGIVVSNKMPKTVVVSVTRLKLHKKYKKQYKVTTNYKADNSMGEVKPGDMVIIQECRPLSRDKHWQLVRKI